VLSNLFISGITKLQNNCFINKNYNSNGDLFVSNNTFFNTVSLVSNLYVSGISYINNDLTVYNNIGSVNNLIVTGNTIFNYLSNLNNTYLPNTTILTSLNISGNTNIIGLITIGSLLNICNNTINLGKPNSIINILGTTTFIAVNNFIVNNKYINLNSNTYGTALDIGSNCGIEINSINGIDNLYDSKYEKIKVYSDFNFNDAANVVLHMLIVQLNKFILCHIQIDENDEFKKSRVK
jgi:hypothetical protein